MNVYEKLMNVQAELKAPKSQYNSFGKYAYRSCEDILEALKPICTKHKALTKISDEIIFVEGRHYIKATVSFIDIEKGEKIESFGLAREEETKKGMDGSQITGSSSSYARKYALNGMFAIDDTKDSDATNKHCKEDNKANTPGTGTTTNNTYRCNKCAKEIPQNVAKFSYQKYGKSLCMDCQKKEGK